MSASAHPPNGVRTFRQSHSPSWTLACVALRKVDSGVRQRRIAATEMAPAGARVQRRDRLRAAPADGAVIAIAEGEPLPRVPPARRSLFLARRIAAARPRRRAARFTRARCGA